MTFLDVGSHRLGHVYDQNPGNEALVVGLLTRDSEGVWLEIPWEERSDPVASGWFSPLLRTSQPGAGPPNQLTFVDTSGRVTLVGLTPKSVQRERLSQHGSGLLQVRYAVEGTAGLVDFSSGIHVMRSGVDGLRRFMLTDADDPVGSRRVPLNSVESLRVEHVVNRERQFRESLLITEFEDVRPWADHLARQSALRDLLTAVFWWPCLFMSHNVKRLDDRPHGDRWRYVVTEETGMGALAPMDTLREPLFGFTSIGVQGLDQWLTLRQEWAKAFDHLIGLARMQDALIDVQFMQLGVGLEALGYHIARGQMPRKKAKGLAVAKYLDHILKDAPLAWPFIDLGWAAETAKLYNQVKHVDRNRAPDRERLRARLSDSILVFRLWLAGKLGVLPSNINGSAVHQRQPLEKRLREHWDALMQDRGRGNKTASALLEIVPLGSGEPPASGCGLNGREAHRAFYRSLRRRVLVAVGNSCIDWSGSRGATRPGQGFVEDRSVV